MKTKSKALLLTMCAIVLVVSAVFGTMAYLTDTDSATNTFTVGKVGLKLDEADVKTDGTLDTNDRVQGNEYHLIPGHTYIKDPTVTVKADSEDAYVRMKVKVENIDQLTAALPDSGDTAKYYATDKNSNRVFLLQMLCNGWDDTTWVYEGYANGVYEFRYKAIVEKNTEATELDALFDSITVPGEIDNDHLENLAGIKIVVTAEAIQADGFDTAEKAWTAFVGQVNP